MYINTDVSKCMFKLEKSLKYFSFNFFGNLFPYIYFQEIGYLYQVEYVNKVLYICKVG